jgi:hypothetical protein
MGNHNDDEEREQQGADPAWHLEKILAISPESGEFQTS